MFEDLFGDGAWIPFELFSDPLDGRSLVESFLDERSVLLRKMGIFDCLGSVGFYHHLGFLPGNPKQIILTILLFLDFFLLE